MRLWQYTVIATSIALFIPFSIVNAEPAPNTIETIPDVVVEPASTSKRVNVISLDEAIVIAVKRSPLAARFQYLVKGSEDQVKAAKNLRYPQISLQANRGRVPDSTNSSKTMPATIFSASAVQTIYDFGKIKGQILEAESNTEAKIAEFEDSQNQVALKVGQAYTDILRSQDLINATVQGKKALEHIRNMSKLRSDAGLSSSSDYQQADVRIQALNANLAQFVALLGSAESSLASQTGLTAKSYMALPQAMEILPIDHITVFDQIPSLINAEANRAVADARIKQVKADRFPVVAYQYNYNHNALDSGNYGTQSSQFVLKNNPLQGNLVGNKIKSAENERNAAQAQIDNVRRELNEQVSIYAQNLVAAQTKELAYSAQYQQAKKTSETFQEEYKLGKRGLFELLNIEQQVLDANIARINSSYEQKTIRLQYAALVNKLRYLVAGSIINTSAEK